MFTNSHLLEFYAYVEQYKEHFTTLLTQDTTCAYHAMLEPFHSLGTSEPTDDSSNTSETIRESFSQEEPEPEQYVYTLTIYDVACLYY